MAKFTSSANSTVTCFAWENLQEFFVMLVAEMLLLSSLEVFLFPGFFSLQPTLLLAFSGPWRPPPSLSSTLATFSCFTFARLFCHNFTSHRRFLPYAPWPTFLELFVTQMRAGTPRPGSSSVLDLTEFSLPADSWAWTWTHCSYKTIDLSIAPVSHEV